MPWKVVKSGSGYRVANKDKPGKKYSKKPQSEAMAKKQLAALYANAKEAFETRLDNAIIEATSDIQYMPSKSCSS